MRKLFAISMVKNEGDIIESFVRYHLHVFDGIVILDNGSTDRTVPILELLQLEGLPVHIKHDTSLEYAQGEKTTALLYDTFENYNPDIILPLDADEFVIAANDRDHPRDILNGMDPHKIHYIQTRQYAPDRTDDENELFIPKRILQSYGDVNLYKVAVTNRIARSFSPALSMGNHHLIFHEPLHETVVSEDSSRLRLAHFALRSIEQAKSKILVGWLNNITRPNRHKDDCFHWEYYFNLLKQKQDLDETDSSRFIRDLYGDAPTYAHPIDLSFCPDLKLRYTGPSEVNAVRNLLNFSEKLALEYAELKRKAEPS